MTGAITTWTIPPERGSTRQGSDMRNDLHTVNEYSDCKYAATLDAR